MKIYTLFAIMFLILIAILDDFFVITLQYK